MIFSSHTLGFSKKDEENAGLPPELVVTKVGASFRSVQEGVGWRGAGRVPELDFIFISK